MTLPSLADFIQSIPASSVSEQPQRWLEDCLLSGSDYLILLNADNVPVKGLTLHHLFGLVDSSAQILPSSPHFGPGAEPVSPLPNTGLEQFAVKFGMISVTTATESAVQMVAAAPELCWVAVDEQQRYQGLIDKPRLLAAAWRSLTVEDPFEETLTETEGETQTSRSNTALLTYLGHELKTPLTSLLGLSSLLKMGELGELTPRQSRYIGLIQQHCRRLAAWVNTLIDLGRIESGALRLVPQLVEVSEIWPDAYRQAALRVGREATADASLPLILQSDTQSVTLVADRTRLQQMLTCLMQTALAAQGDALSSPSTLPLSITLWDNWVAFLMEGLDETLSLEQIGQAIVTLPFPAMPVPSTPITTEMGHWLEWLLVRKLAQQHQGELVLTVQANAKICPTLLLPMTPTSAAVRRSRFLLVVAPLDLDSLSTLWQQANQLNYQLLITPHVKDAVEVATHLPVAAVLVWLQSHQMGADLQWLKVALAETESLTVALVPPQLSAALGDLPLERELLWPTDRLGSVLLGPRTVVPAPNRLTILYLRSADQAQSSQGKFPHIFHDFGCRVLEVDDLEQASLLRRVWKPHVAVLDPAIADPSNFLKHLSQFAELTSLPLITLTMAAAHAAHEIPAISAYPCLVEEASWATPESVERLTTWLIQVLQVAAAEAPNR